MLTRRQATVSEERSSRKQPLSEREARALIDSVDTIVIAKGKKAVEHPASEATPADLQGRDLLPLVAAGGGRERPIFSAEERMLAVRYGGWKLIATGRGDRRQLFDLTNDPGERHDLFAERPDKAAELERLLELHREESRGILAQRPAHRQKLDPETAAKLKALGYL